MSFFSFRDVNPWSLAVRWKGSKYNVSHVNGFFLNIEGKELVNKSKGKSKKADFVQPNTILPCHSYIMFLSLLAFNQLAWVCVYDINKLLMIWH